MTTFPRDNSLFVFGYNTPEGCQLRLNTVDNSAAFDECERKLESLTHLESEERTLFFPFDLNINDRRFACLTKFSFSDWYLAAGLFNRSEGRCYRVFLIHKKDHDLAISYDFGSASLLAVAANGFGLFDETGEECDGEEVYDLLGFAEEEKPALKAPEMGMDEVKMSLKAPE
jgi:hypothetical protein